MGRFELPEHISVRDVFLISTDAESKIDIPEDVRRRVEESRRTLERLLEEGKVIYGVNTGFGKLASVRISQSDIEELQVNLLRSHATGTGEPLPEEVVRAMLFLRLFSLSRGYSGVRWEIIERLGDFINNGVHPVVPRYGSVGASGDLTPLAHMALPLIGEGEVYLKHTRYPSLIAHRMLGMEPITLQAKEGLALINGLQYSQSLLSLAYYRVESLFYQSLTIFLLALWVAGSRVDAYSSVLKAFKESEGFHEVLDYLRPHLKDFVPAFDRVQDPYSLRVSPQVYGAILDNLHYIKRVLEQEINSVNDNPLFVEGEVYFTGMFHGEALAFAGDLLHMSISEMASLSERRSFFLLEQYDFLTPEPGINSGFMVAQVSQASLVSTLKNRSYPASVDSIPTSGNQEDFVSMSSVSALKSYESVDRLEDVLAWELYMVLQALRISGRWEKLPDSLKRIYTLLIEDKRYRVKLPDRDVYMVDEHRKLVRALKSGELLLFEDS